MKSKGFGVVGIIVVAAAVILLGVVAWRIYDANKNKKQDNTSTQQPSSQNQNISNDKQPSTPQQADPNAGYVVIKDWDVRFKPTEGFDGVEYFKPSSVTTDSVSFTTTQLAQLEPTCGTASSTMVLGLLTRSKEVLPGYGGVVATVGGYNFQYRASGAACSKNQANAIVESKAVTSLNASLKSLEVAQ